METTDRKIPVTILFGRYLIAYFAPKYADAKANRGIAIITNNPTSSIIKDKFLLIIKWLISATGTIVAATR